MGVTVTDKPQFEDLTDLGTGGALTFKLSRINGLDEFQLEGVLSSPGVEIDIDKLCSVLSSIDKLCSVLSSIDKLCSALSSIDKLCSALSLLHTIIFSRNFFKN